MEFTEIKKPEKDEVFVYDTFEDIEVEDGQNVLTKIYAIRGLSPEEQKDCPPYFFNPQEALDKKDEILSKRSK